MNGLAGGWVGDWTPPAASVALFWAERFLTDLIG